MTSVTRTPAAGGARPAPRAPTPVAEAAPPGCGMRLVRRVEFARMTAPHRHRSVEFNLVMDGSSTCLLNDRHYRLGPGSLVWLFPGQEHIVADRSPRCCDWLGLFDPAALAPACTSDETRTLLAADPSGSFARRLSAEEARRLDRLFRDVTRGTDPDTVTAGLRYAMLAAWEAFRTAAQAPPSTAVHPAVVEAVRLLQAARPVRTVTELARTVGLSPHHLSRLFRAGMGVGIARFRNENRLQRVVDIRESDAGISLLDAALQAGFGSYPQFYRVVRELTGRPPSQLFTTC